VASEFVQIWRREISTNSEATSWIASEVHEIVKDGDFWKPVGSLEPMRAADQVVAEDGEVIKERHSPETYQLLKDSSS